MYRKFVAFSMYIIVCSLKRTLGAHWGRAHWGRAHWGRKKMCKNK